MYKLIRDRKVTLGITQQDLADFSEVSLRMIKSIELGKANLSISTLLKLLDVLGLEIQIKIKEIVTGEANSNLL